jgi:hypothetical protein
MPVIVGLLYGLRRLAITGTSEDIGRVSYLERGEQRKDKDAAKINTITSTRRT